MKTQSGSTRRVFVFNKIVIKIARIYWKDTFITILYEIKSIKNDGMKKYFSDKKRRKRTRLEDQQEHKIKKEKHWEGMEYLPLEKSEFNCSIPYYFLRGIIANIQEKKFWKENKNPFVMPTYFSFFGLFNIQKKGEEVYFWTTDKIWNYILENSQNENQPLCDGHTLRNIRNFVLDGDKKIKLVDYGSRQACEFLKINGETLYNNFKYPEEN